MAVDRTFATLGLVDATVEVLRAGLATALTGAQGEGDLAGGYATGAAGAFDLPTIRSQDILVGDHPQMIPNRLVQVRVFDADHEPTYALSQGGGRGRTRFKVRVYTVAQRRANSDPDPTVISTLERVAMAMSGAVISTLEQGLETADARIHVVQVLRDRPLETPRNLRINRVLIKVREVQVSVTLAHRVAHGLSSP